MSVEYRKEKTDKVLEKYRDLVEKTFTVIDMDKLEDELKKAETDEGSESRLLTKVTNRKKALELIEDVIERIERLENKKEDNNGEDKKEMGEPIHPTKLYARK